MKNKLLAGFTAIILVAVVLFSCDNKKGILAPEFSGTTGTVVVPLVDCDTITYTKHIKPIVTGNCTANCHKPGNSQAAPQYDYETHSGLMQSGTVKLRNRVIIIHDMPKFSPNPDGLPALEKKIFECWLDKGAPNN